MRKIITTFLVAIVLFGCATTASAFGSAGGQLLGALGDGRGNASVDMIMGAYAISSIGI